MSDVPPLVRIRPPARWQTIDFPALWRHRGLLWALASRDIKLRYRQTALGVLWVVFQPLLGAGIFAFVFGSVAKLDSGNIPYVVFSYAGLLAWNLFSSIVLKSATSLISNAALVSKVFFPRLILPLSTAISSLLDFAIGLLAGLALMLAQGFIPSPSPLVLLFVLILVLVLALGLGLICSALVVAYRDVNHLLPVALQLLLYASPVGYALAAVPARWRELFSLNPLAPLIENFRATLLGGAIDPRGLFTATAISLAVFLAGVLIFRHRERQFADVI